MQFIDEANIVTYVDFDCGITFYPETPTKIRQINREQNYTSRSSESPKCTPGSNQQNCSFDEQHSSNISLNLYNFRHMVPSALMSLSHSNDRYSMSNQYPQRTTHQPRTDSCPVFSSLRTMDSKRKGLRVSFTFFQRNYLPDGRVNETVATVEELSDLWKPERWMEFRRLWWTVNVFKCSHLFHWFDFYCLLVEFLLFLKIYFFCSFLWGLWVRSKTSSTSSM